MQGRVARQPLDGLLRQSMSGGVVAFLERRAGLVELAGGLLRDLLVDAPDLDTVVALAESCPEAEYGDVRVLQIDD